MRRGAGKLAPAEIRSKEHIPEASDTSGWEIAADAVVVSVAADRQEYLCSLMLEVFRHLSTMLLASIGLHPSANNR